MEKEIPLQLAGTELSSLAKQSDGFKLW